MDPLKAYEQELATIQPLASEEEAHLFLQSQKSGVQAENAKKRLIESKVHLVLSIARRHESSGLSMAETDSGRQPRSFQGRRRISSGSSS